MTGILGSDSTRLVLGLEEPWQSHAHDGCSLDLRTITKSPHPLSGGVLIFGGSPDRDLGSRRPTESTLEAELENNNGATYQRLVDKIFRPQSGRNVELYLHDMLVKSKEARNHVADLEEIFVVLRKYRLKLNPEKYHPQFKAAEQASFSPLLRDKTWSSPSNLVSRPLTLKQNTKPC
ncbi:UNVERIFIED_CONTAM: hypothetical protein Scaly_2591100 [Sesamum calycinum]|uniref:Reverse transcriptase domain-containing protein n=1 Tax=Sesamum calycinum TaxID=2727403 RepID=A0AAW2JDZ3_9LAMI